MNPVVSQSVGKSCFPKIINHPFDCYRSDSADVVQITAAFRPASQFSHEHYAATTKTTFEKPHRTVARSIRVSATDHLWQG